MQTKVRVAAAVAASLKADIKTAIGFKAELTAMGAKISAAISASASASGDFFRLISNPNSTFTKCHVVSCKKILRYGNPPI